MKNLKIAMILVAAVALFCSCGKEKTVDVTMTEKNETLTYDLSSAASLPISITCTVTADLGIKTIDVKREIMNGDSVVKTVNYEFEEEFVNSYVGEPSFKFEIPDTLLKADLAKDYTVVYTVNATDKKDNPGSKTWTITVTESATPISANWSEIIYLTRSDQTNQALVDGTQITASENTTFGVKMKGSGSNSGSENTFTKTANCEGFVVVTEDYTTVEELAEAYAAGTVVTEISVPFKYHDKSTAVKTFISKVDGNYVLVQVASAYNCAGVNGAYTFDDGHSVQATVLGFQYKKAETPAPAAK
jgi:hypothetical protein